MKVYDIIDKREIPAKKYTIAHEGGAYELAREVYNIDYIVDSNKEYKIARIMVACGGPNIYIDTDKQAVCLYWWSDRAQYYLSKDAIDAVDDFAREMYEC